MIEISFGKLLLLALIALIVLGPEKLPTAARTAGALLRRVRTSWDSVRAEVERELQVDEIRRTARETVARMDAAQAELDTTLQQVRDVAAGAASPDAAADPATGAEAGITADPAVASAADATTGIAAGTAADIAAAPALPDAAADPTTGAQAGALADHAVASAAAGIAAGTAADIAAAAVPIAGSGSGSGTGGDPPTVPGVPAGVAAEFADTLTGDLFASAPARSAPDAAAAAATPELPHGAA